MRITRIGYALGIAAAVAIAGCSSNGSSLGPIAQAPGSTQSVVRNHPITLLPGAVLRQINPGTPYMGKSWASPDASGTLVYVCMFTGGACNWYKSGGHTLKGQIAASYPNGLCDDANGNVYIPDGGTAHVFEYAKGSATQIADLDNTSQGQPSACAVDKNGTLYVGNIAADTVSVYNVGATTPSRIITVNAVTGGAGYVIGVSVDEHHLLSVSWINFNTGTSGVDEFPRAHGTGHTKISLGTDFPGTQQFDNAENIEVNDQSTGTTNVYNGTTFALCNSFANGSGDAVTGALNKPNTKIVEGDAVNGAAYEESFGDCSGGGALLNTITAGLSASGTVIGTLYDPGSQI